MKLSVIIPTYRRAESLNLCLKGLQMQVRSPDEVLVVIQDSDEESIRLLETWKEWRPLKVLRQAKGALGGLVPQGNVGLEASTGDVIVFTDDDAVPRPDWLLRIEKYFESEADLGGVGGRDFVQENGVLLTGNARKVGVVQWFGRVTHGHHIGTLKQPSVDILKGVNMAYRADAIRDIRFDKNLRGKGAQTCIDMAFSLDVQRHGWRLLYDPEVAVDHFPAKRFDADQRKAPTLQAIEDNSFNVYLTLRRHLRPGLRRRAALLWAQWVGVERTPGFIRGMVSRLKGDSAGMEMRAAARRAWRAAKQISGGD